jgi:hypothetical protein
MLPRAPEVANKLQQQKFAFAQTTKNLRSRTKVANDKKPDVYKKSAITLMRRNIVPKHLKRRKSISKKFFFVRWVAGSNLGRSTRPVTVPSTAAGSL